MGNKVCVIDYGMGNLMSVFRALELIEALPAITGKPEDLSDSDKIILPGVGAFSVAMDNLKRLGFIDALYEEVIVKKKPFLGICLGMQLIAEESCEFGHHKGLGWIPATVKMLEVPDELRLPHMGWNDIKAVVRENSLFEGIHSEMVFYFVHSYHVHCFDEKYIGSTCDYGQNFVSSIQHENIYAVQFHPEKSQKNGIQVLRNFMEIKG